MSFAASDAVLSGFQPVGDYLLEIDGKTAPKAEILRSERARGILILASQLPSPVLVSPASGAVETLNLMKVARQKDGSVDLLADAVLAPQGRFEVAGENVVFTVDGHRVRMLQRPYLVGAKTAADLRGDNPEYARKASAYEPAATAVAALRAERREVRVRVFFGSWCAFCKQHVPYLLRLEEELKGAKVRFDYYGLPRPFIGEPEATRMKVTGVPTAVVFVGGREIGRLEQPDDWKAPETALVELLSSAGQARRPKTSP